MKSTGIDRRVFVGQSLSAAAAATLSSCRAPAEAAKGDKAKRTRVGVIGCGSVSNVYLPHLSTCSYVELVSVCDIKPDRAKRQAVRFKIPNHYPHIDDLLTGAAFDLLVNLTDMQEHEHLNREAIAAGKHIWSEKPIANSLKAGQALLEQAKTRGVKVWGAPTVVNSPQFACMAKILAGGSLGRVAAAHADYGHTGPNWSSFFYEKGGGSMPDLGVYNLTSLTGLLGPARSVVALTSVVTPTRHIRDKGLIKVSEEDNAMVLKGDYVWQQGASLVAESLVTGKEPLFTAEHALHVVEIICAARQSQETGRRIDLKSSFKWPIVS